jgi:homocitrate synthase NifV
MVRITDMTPSCLDAFSPTRGQLTALLDLLLSAGADFVEMPAQMYREIDPPSFNRLVLRIGSPDETADYPEVTRFICRISGMAAGPEVISEIQMNEVKELHLFSRYGMQNVRITGLDDLLCHDYEASFALIKKQFGGRIEFCPENSFYCATATAVEWILNGGTNIVTAFGGIGGKAPLEEVLLALRVIKKHKPGASYTMFPEITALLEEIMSVRFHDRKAVIGKRIFDVESGIHVDGILKRPGMYEPFMPELVGASRRFIVGKHSGRNSIRVKLREVGFDPARYDCDGMLGRVREESIKKHTSLTDEEFIELANRHRK